MLAIREEKERSAVDRVKTAYGEKYNPMLMHDRKLDVTNLFNEDPEIHFIREDVRRKQQRKDRQLSKSKRHEQER